MNLPVAGAHSAPVGDRDDRIRALEAENAQLREELARAKGGSHQTILGMADLLVATDRTGAIGYLNSAAEKHFNVVRDRVTGQPITALQSAEFDGAVLAQLVAEAIAAGGQATRELTRSVGTEVKSWLLKATVSDAGAQLLISDRSDIKRMEMTLARYISPSVMEQVMKAGVDPFKARKYELTVLFADLRGFTSMSSTLTAEQVKTLIDEYLTVQIDVVLNAGATIDKIVGDEVMALFGAPLPVEDHALWAINTALQMANAHKRLMEVWQRRGVTGCALGIGLNTGEMVVGNIGSHRRMDYTVLGHHVNLGARLCSGAKPGEIMMSSRTFELAKASLQKNPAGAWRPLKFKRGEPLSAKGLKTPVETILVVEA